MRLDELTDVTYEVDRGLAWITINRPDVYNAFRGRTVDELIRCFKAAWADREVGVVALTGAGDKAFCAGGDQKQRAETGDYGPTENGLFEVEHGDSDPESPANVPVGRLDGRPRRRHHARRR